MSIHMAGPIAFMESSGSAVYFSKNSASAGTFKTQEGTSTVVKKAQTALEVAYWGEDNRFPQNIEQQMAYCGIGKAALDWKARALYGAGIIPGRVRDYEDDGKTEIFEPLTRKEGKDIYAFLENRSMFRFFLEYLQDWTWYSNVFPEVILSKDGEKITGFVHQESCDARYKQMNDKGLIENIYLSKLWGSGKNQYAKFDPEKKILGLIENPAKLTEIDNKFLKSMHCIDMYDAVDSLKLIADKLVKTRKADQLKSAILPVNYPSVNKTYYQVPSWDGARLGGWVEIACKVPSLIKTLYNKAFRLKYHIQVPESYFERQYGFEKWHGKTEEEQKEARRKLLQDMDDYLTGDTNAFHSFISFFDIAPHDKTEYGKVTIESIEDKTNIDKDLITTSAANVEILMAMQVHPSLFSAGAPGATHRSGGGSGSDIREAFLVYNALLNLERQVLLEPLYLARDYNQWGDDIVFRVRDTQLTTLDKNSGTQKVIS